MNNKTLQALQDSIAHWQRLASGVQESIGPSRCALCKLFNSGTGKQDTDCIGCPVFDHTGENYCKGTPYEAVQYEYDAMGYTDEFKHLAQLELEFLQSLLPDNENEQTNQEQQQNSSQS